MVSEKYILFVVGICGLFINEALAQSPSNCAQAASMDFNQTNLFGDWYEVARQPQQSNEYCVEFDAHLLADNTTLNIAKTYASSTSFLHKNQTIFANITLQAGSLSGYNVSYSLNGNTVGTPMLIKLLKSYQLNNSDTFLVGCGYANSADMSTSFGFILSRVRFVNASLITNVNNQAATLYSNFINNNVSTVTQSDSCYANSAVTTLPALFALLACVYILWITI